MCSAQTVYDSGTDREYGTPRELRKLVGSVFLPACEDPDDEDCCLCPVDVAGILTAACFDYEGGNGDGFYVNSL